MKKSKLILTVALIAAASLTVVSVTGNVKSNNIENSTEISEKQKPDRTKYIKEKLSEKLETGEIDQEKYDEIIRGIESGEFGGRRGPHSQWGRWGKAGEMTDEQKAEIKEKIKEKLSEKLENGEIDQEKYDEIIRGIESGEFGGRRGPHGQWGRWGKAGEMTDEQKAAIAEKRAEMMEKGCFGGFRGHRGNDENISE